MTEPERALTNLDKLVLQKMERARRLQKEEAESEVREVSLKKLNLPERQKETEIQETYPAPKSTMKKTSPMQTYTPAFLNKRPSTEVEIELADGQKDQNSSDLYEQILLDEQIERDINSKPSLWTGLKPSKRKRPGI